MTSDISSFPKKNNNVNFSLFDGDLFNQLWRKLKLPNTRVRYYIYRAGIVFFISWVITAILALNEGLYSRKVYSESFFLDFGALFGGLLGNSVLIIAEYCISNKLKWTFRFFNEGGILDRKELPKLEELTNNISIIRKNSFPEIACLIIAYELSIICFLDFLIGGKSTWQVIDGMPTFAGLWCFLIGIPISGFLWTRWVWKSCIWSYFLYRLSKLSLRLNPTHPDKTAGLDFLGGTQAHFGYLLFAAGCWVSSIVGFHLVIENNSLLLLSGQDN